MMSMRSLSQTLLIAVAGFASAVSAMEPRFDRITPEDGLSQFSANAVIQDSQGYLWIGTQDGLNRYDGYEFVVHKTDPEDPQSLWDNFVLSLWADSDGSFWITSNSAGAINRYDPFTETMARFRLEPSSDPEAPAPAVINNRALWKDEQGRLWVGTFGGGLFVLDPATGVTEHLFARSGVDGSLTDNGISRIQRDSAGEVWVGTFGGGLYRRLPPRAPGAAESFVRYANDPDDPASLAYDVVTEVYEDSAGVLWVSTAGAGLARLDRETGGFEHIRADASSSPRLAGDVIAGNQAAGSGRPRRLSLGVDERGAHSPGSLTPTLQALLPRPECHFVIGRVNVLFEDSAGHLWVGTIGGGLFLYDRKHDEFVQFTLDPADPQGLSSNIVSTIFEDRSGIVWFGTGNGGVASFSRHKHRFEQLRLSPSDPDGLTDSKVVLDSRRRPGDPVGGHSRWRPSPFDRRRERVLERYSLLPGSPQDIGNGGVRAVYEDKRGNLWAGTQGAGFSLIDREAGVVERSYVANYDDSAESEQQRRLRLLRRQPRRTVGRHQRRPQPVRPRRGNVRPVRQRFTGSNELAEQLRPLCLRGAERQSVGGRRGGFSLFDRETESFTNYARRPDDPASLANDNVMDLLEDGEGGIWVATYGGGLDHCSIESGRCSHFTTADGLPTDSIYSLLPDEEGYLWVSSNQGLSRFDPRTRTIRNYDASDGLGGNEFNGRSFFVAADGEMLFGGMHGLTSFYPGGPRTATFCRRS